jgi:Rps23 Pro-64 3,4-dihydroxylase Tpa1-like proline 4-hydroxylase|tara:strand:- start:63 stop:608 length:546 start_codon:yes stop_codon:yes gene_type:complete
MRKTLFTHGQVYNLDQVKELNKLIKKNFITTAMDKPAQQSVKTSEIKFVKLGSVGSLLNPFIQFCISANVNAFGFDLFPLNADKILNLNIYNKGTEYNWHTDGEPNNPIRDIKLTCLLNLSEDDYEGGNLKLFDGKEIDIENFNKPGSAVIFPSFINHKVTKLIKGERYTLAIWWYGPKFK